MATKSFVVDSYTLIFRSSDGWVLQLRGHQSAADPQPKQICTIRFVDDEAAPKPPITNNNLSYAEAWFKRKEMPALIDVLRNEKPIYLTINVERPGQTPVISIWTGAEPTGDAEK